MMTIATLYLDVDTFYPFYIEAEEAQNMSLSFPLNSLATFVYYMTDVVDLRDLNPRKFRRMLAKVLCAVLRSIIPGRIFSILLITRYDVVTKGV